MAASTTSVIHLNLLIYLLTNLNSNSAVELKLTNIQCNAVDPGFVTFLECRLKLVTRGLVTLNVDAELHQKATSCVITSALLKRASGYKPFLFNGSIDACKFLENPRINLPFAILARFVAEYTNGNHSCPYSHNIIVKDLMLTEDKFRLIPLPSGEYKEQLGFIANGKLRATVNVFFSRIE